MQTLKVSPLNSKMPACALPLFVAYEIDVVNRPAASVRMVEGEPRLQHYLRTGDDRGDVATRDALAPFDHVLAQRRSVEHGRNHRPLPFQRRRRARSSGVDAPPPRPSGNGRPRAAAAPSLPRRPRESPRSSVSRANPVPGPVANLSRPPTAARRQTDRPSVAVKLVDTDVASASRVPDTKQQIEVFGFLRLINDNGAFVRGAHSDGCERTPLDDDHRTVDVACRHLASVGFKRSDVPRALQRLEIGWRLDRDASGRHRCHATPDHQRDSPWSRRRAPSRSGMWSPYAPR